MKKKFFFSSFGKFQKKILEFLTHWISDSKPNYRNFILYVTSMAEYNILHPDNPQYTLLDESAAFMKVIHFFYNFLKFTYYIKLLLYIQLYHVIKLYTILYVLYNSYIYGKVMKIIKIIQKFFIYFFII